MPRARFNDNFSFLSQHPFRPYRGKCINYFQYFYIKILGGLVIRHKMQATLRIL